jgi:ribonuclease HI
MRKLNQFPGFQIGSSKPQIFNPFAAEDLTPIPVLPKVALNVLDAPTATGPSVLSFLSEQDSSGQAKDEEQKSLIPIPATPLIIPMIQPISKDGKRLLYKHPSLPKVGVRGSYELLVGESDRSATAWLIQFDGAANPNPGPASAGAILWSPSDIEGKRRPIFESGKYLGKATNNIAEVQGLVLGLEIAAMRGAREILIEGDSELIIFHQTGKYRVSDKNLKVWWSIAQAAMMDETAFDWIAIRQVRREFNERADSITKEVLSRKQSFQR